MYVYRDYFILHPNQVICRVWSLRLFYRLSLWLAYMLHAKIVINKKLAYYFYQVFPVRFRFHNSMDDRRGYSCLGPVDWFYHQRSSRLNLVCVTMSDTSIYGFVTSLSSLTHLCYLPRYVLPGHFQSTCDDKSGYQHVLLYPSFFLHCEFAEARLLSEPNQRLISCVICSLRQDISLVLRNCS